MQKSKFYGKLEPEVLQELDSLLIKLKSLNEIHKGKRVIKKTEIVPLPDKEYLRLWELVRHCCRMISFWGNVTKAIGIISSKRGQEVQEVREECIDYMTIHVLTYAWRHYEHSEECGYVFSTAEYGWRAWIEEQNNYHSGFEIELQKQAEENCGRKVCTLNFA